MLKALGISTLAAVTLVMLSCAGFNPDTMRQDPNYYYGMGMGRSKQVAMLKARDDLISNAIIEAGGKFTRKEKAVQQGSKDKLDSSFQVTTEMIRNFELPEIEPFLQDRRGSDFIVVYRFARVEWAKVQRKREARLRSELAKVYDEVIANPARPIEERILEAGRLVDRLAREGLSDRLTRAADDQSLLASAADMAARDLSQDIVISLTPARGLIGNDPITVACRLKTGGPAASIPLRVQWKAGGSTREASLFADKDGLAQLRFPFASEPDFRDRGLSLRLTTNFSARMADSSLVNGIDMASLVELRYRHVSNFKDFLADMVEVPAGPFKAGAPARDKRAEASEKARQVQVEAFSIGRNEVTNALYSVYIDDRGLPPSACPEYWDNPAYNRPEQPVIAVSWNEAKAFAEWLSEASGQPGLVLRLPTEDEWEKAARAGSDSIYPWGDESPKVAARANFSGNGRFDGVAPVGSFATGKNAYGLNDMAGNAAEWTASPPDAFLSGDPSLRIIKGGSWSDGPLDLRISRREARDPSSRGSDVGFRLVKEIPNE